MFWFGRWYVTQIQVIQSRNRFKQTTLKQLFQEARRQELLDQGYSAAQIDAIFVRQHRQEVMAEVCRHWFP